MAKSCFVRTPAKSFACPKANLSGPMKAILLSIAVFTATGCARSSRPPDRLSSSVHSLKGTEHEPLRLCDHHGVGAQFGGSFAQCVVQYNLLDMWHFALVTAANKLPWRCLFVRH